MTGPNMISPKSLMRLIGTPKCPQLIDVCMPEDFAADPRVIPTSRRIPHAEIAQIAPSLQGAPVVVICQKGKKLSQGAAALLRSHGLQAEALAGGVLDWREAGQPLTPDAKRPLSGALWVTRHRPKVDRIACPWLIRRFIDPQARFLYVAPDAVLDVAEKFGAIPFDVSGAAFSHAEGACTFDALMRHFELETPALAAMAEVIRAADGAPGAAPPQAAGLLALSVGLSRLHSDDLAQLDAGLTLYDALYLWARDGTAETHAWDTHEART